MRYDFCKKKDFSDKKIIWQYWGQGLEDKNLPEIIRICFASVDKYCSDYKVIRLTDRTISEYLDFPAFVWEKVSDGRFSRTAFSDLLRVALLRTYGGIWLDATILLTGVLPSYLTASPFFMYQRAEDAEGKKQWEKSYAYYWGWYPGFKVNVLNSVFASHKDDEVVTDLSNLLLCVWENESQVPDYFFFQILFNELMMGTLKGHNCPIVSDCIPHLLQRKVNEGNEQYTLDEITRITPIHKMTYFNEESLSYLKTLLGIK